MKSESVISERGQVTLPKELRDHYGLRSGVKIVFIPSPQGLLIRKGSDEQGNPLREVFGVLKDKIRTDDYLKQTRGKVV